MYKSDITDEEWSLIKELLIFKRRGPKVAEKEVRNKLNAMLYVLKTGCQWHMLPKEYGAVSKIYAQFQRWRDNGILEKILTYLNKKMRTAKGKEETPSLLIMDTQSVKTVQKGEGRGYDGNKKIKGRKRCLVVDTLGLVHGVSVGSAGEHDTKAAVPLIESIQNKFPRLRKILADQGFSGEALRRMVTLKLKALLNIKPDEKIPGAKGFQVVPLRWIVERTNAWTIFDRRLAKDYEHEPKNSALFIMLSAIKRTLKRLKS